MSLFFRLYLDEDVDVLVADLLRARGFSAQTTQEADQIGATDRDQFRYAINKGRTLLTHNRVDFENWPLSIPKRVVNTMALLLQIGGHRTS